VGEERGAHAKMLRRGGRDGNEGARNRLRLKQLLWRGAGRPGFSGGDEKDLNYGWQGWARMRGWDILLRHLLRQGYGGQEGYGGQVGDLGFEIGGRRFGNVGEEE
jgi:hypothetical protein